MRRDFFGAGRRHDAGTSSGCVGATTRFTHHDARHPRPRRRSLGSSATSRPDLVVHCAAQPSHDLAASRPFDDFDVNAVGTLNLLEAARATLPGVAVRLHLARTRCTATRRTSSPLVELETRWDYADPATPRGHRRELPDRRDAPQPLRRVEGRRRRDRAGVRPLLRHADGLLPRRLPHRARTTAAPSCTASSPTSRGASARAARTGSTATRASRSATTSTRSDVCAAVARVRRARRAPARSTTSAAAARTASRSSRRSRASRS